MTVHKLCFLCTGSSHRVLLVSRHNARLLKNIPHIKSQGSCSNVAPFLPKHLAQSSRPHARPPFVVFRLSVAASHNLSHNLSPNLSHNISRNLSPNRHHDLSHDLSRNVSNNLSHDLSRNLSDNLSRNLSPIFHTTFSHNLSHKLRRTFVAGRRVCSDSSHRALHPITSIFL